MNRSLAVIFGLLAPITLSSVQPAEATTIDYNVNFFYQGKLVVSGHIFTNGTIGPLAETDITNWILTVNNGVDAPFTLEGPLSGNNSTADGFNLFELAVDPLQALPAGDLRWTAQQPPAPLPAQGFGFNGAGYRFSFFNPTGGGCCGVPEYSIGGPTMTLTQHLAPGAVVDLGIAPSPAAVPEPATLTLTALGLAAFVTRYRYPRFRSSAKTRTPLRPGDPRAHAADVERPRLRPADAGPGARLPHGQFGRQEAMKK